jgi:hypothetical protein
MAPAATAAVLLALAATAAAPPGRDAEVAAQGASGTTGSGAGTTSGQLALGLRVDPSGATGPLAVDPSGRDPARATPCPIDWCQPRVEVPGLGLSRGGMSRPELVAKLLDDADVAPLASLVWLFAQTGLEVQWTPPHMDVGSGNSGAHGNLFVWLKLRIDAWNRPSFPTRERDRVRREQEAEPVR